MPIQELLKRPLGGIESARQGTEEAFQDISVLAPQVRHDLIVYDSATLSKLILERSPSIGCGSLRHVIDLLHLNVDGDERLEVYFPVSGRKKPDSLSLGQTFFRKLKIGFDERTFGMGRIKVGDDFVISKETPFARDQTFLLRLFETIRDDLKGGRERWANSLREARMTYITEELGQAHGRAVDAVNNLIDQMIQGFPKERFAVFGAPIGKEEGEAKKLIQLFTTMEIIKDVAERIANSHMGINNYYPQKMIYERELPSAKRSIAGHLYHSNSGILHILYPGFDLTLGSFYPGMLCQPSIVTAWREVLGTTDEKEAEIIERGFRKFMAGENPFFYPLAVHGNVTLLVRHPNSSPTGKLFEPVQTTE